MQEGFIGIKSKRRSNQGTEKNFARDEKQNNYCDTDIFPGPVTKNNKIFQGVCRIKA